MQLVSEQDPGRHHRKRGRESILNEILTTALTDAYDQGFPEDRLDELAAETLTACLPEMTRAITGSLHRTKAGLLAGLANDRNALERGITADYGSAFGNFEAAAQLAYELIADLHDEYVTSGEADKSSPTCQVLFLLHGKACTVAAEVLHLLRGGYADGANARQRTLHEIVVILDLIAGAEDEELAHRYIDYAVVERYRDMLAYQENCEALNQVPFTTDELEQAEQERDEVLRRRGEQFRKPNQWAAPPCFLQDLNRFQLSC